MLEHLMFKQIRREACDSKNDCTILDLCEYSKNLFLPVNSIENYYGKIRNNPKDKLQIILTENSIELKLSTHKKQVINLR